jgi:hypothetical protein
MSVQVSTRGRVCFSEMHVLREQREYAVLEAAQREREARAALEAATRREDPEVPMERARWQNAAESLVRALRALKS